MDTTTVLMQLGGWLAPCVGLWLFGFWWVVVLWHLWLFFVSTFEQLFCFVFERFSSFPDWLCSLNKPPLEILGWPQALYQVFTHFKT